MRFPHFLLMAVVAAGTVFGLNAFARHRAGAGGFGWAEGGGCGRHGWAHDPGFGRSGHGRGHHPRAVTPGRPEAPLAQPAPPVAPNAPSDSATAPR